MLNRKIGRLINDHETGIHEMATVYIVCCAILAFYVALDWCFIIGGSFNRADAVRDLYHFSRREKVHGSNDGRWGWRR